MRRPLFTICVLASAFLYRGIGQAQKMQATYGYYLNGEPVGSLAPSGASAVVLFFAASDCPISNRYVPEMRRIEEEFAARGVVLWFVYPNFGTTADAVKQHEAAYGAENHVLLDPDHQLVTLAHAKVTPESAVLVPDRRGGGTFRAVYEGRVDDRYLSLGQERSKATQHDLERAISDVLEGRVVEQPNGPAVGCGIIGRP
ncbi:redoxin domain-containing protein [Tunturibacter psychrotolerans]|uniref:Redoxin domain-containing protein n=1 Tax=Tunturiibacter psychrotolerans TaxID=3069686 RepID=A0AAU7ZPL5_9BACT